MPIHKRLLYNKATLTYKALNGLTPEYVDTKFSGSWSTA